MILKRLLISILCCAVLAAAGSAFADTASVRVGELTWLQQDSTERSASLKAMQAAFSVLVGGFGETAENDTAYLYFRDKEIIYYDNLNSMLLALQSGEIDAAELYSSVCRYIRNQNSDHLKVYMGDQMNEIGPRIENRVLMLNLMDALFSVDFSFMFLEGQEPLRDLFNGALKELREDGTKDRLLQEEIADIIFNPEKKIIPAVSAPIEGAETIRVGVTGALPPVDYFTEAGKPAGYSTRILAEISRRIGYNIEFVSVDPSARVLALSSGKVDVIFWARNHAKDGELVNTLVWKTLFRDHPDLTNDLSEDEQSMIRSLRDAAMTIRAGENEQMEGTILSDPFYSDWYAYLVRKE